MKRIIYTAYIAVLVAMAAATVVEKQQGSDWVGAHFYGAWWFALLWGVLAASGIFFYIRHRAKSLAVTALHVAFVVILLGALLTHLTAERGMMHLRQGQPTATWMRAEGGTMVTDTLPFSLRLDRFTVNYHDGTMAAQDYRSEISILEERGRRKEEGGKRKEERGKRKEERDLSRGAIEERGKRKEEGERVTVSMNNILTHRSYRFYQASYDDDGRGTVLSVSTDPWGIPVTYTGYALLFLALVAMLIEPRGTFRRLLKHPALRRGALSLVGIAGNIGWLGFGGMIMRNIRHLGLIALTGLLAAPGHAASPTLPRATADRLGRLCILSGDRICPLQTYALDLTKKLTGARSYEGLSPEQVVAGLLFHGDEWMGEPLIRVKDGPLKERFGLPDHCPVNAFFGTDGYILGPLVEEYWQGNHDKLHQQVADMDSRLQLVMELRQGIALRVLPYTFDRAARGFAQGQTVWFSPADSLPPQVEKEHARYIREVFPRMAVDVRAGRFDRVDVYLDKMAAYQRMSGGTSLPSPPRLRAERAYNAVPFATVLFMANLTLGFLALGLTIWRMSRNERERTDKKRITAGLGDAAKPSSKWLKAIDTALPVLLALSWLALTVALALRWVVSGHIPMGNGYETMLLVAWFVQLVALAVCRRARIVLVFGFLLSGFFLLVSHINQMDPAIGQMMPVLNSPLLSVHVSIVMMAYALLSLTFLCALMGLAVRRMADALAVLSRLFLLPAMTCLGLGIFIGAIWANVSWGSYWSWDPKETWALITFMLYALPLHRRTLTALARPRAYHAYMAVAFLSIIITYFGVNYVLGGMHSYA